MYNTPILFLEPIFKQMIWGGNRLKSTYNYNIPGDDTGECWGISAHPHGDTTLKTPAYAGMTLSELWNTHRELFGNLEGDCFPLLVKIIDAKTDLSIQVHPDDAYSLVNENGSLGKTECWYILDCPMDATLVLGHNAKSKAELESMIQEGRWQDFLRFVPIKKGDFIQIDPGTVHAITSGCLLLETQQNSDITYRIYDYDRLSNGKPRELHVEKSLAVINTPEKPSAEMITHTRNLVSNQWNELISCKYYTVFKADVHGSFSFEQSYPFFNMTVIEGTGTINGIDIKKGDHFILPANFGKAFLQGNMEILSSCVKP